MLIRKSNREDPDQNASERSSQIWVCPVCLGFCRRQLLFKIIGAHRLDTNGFQVCVYGKCSKILNTIFLLFSNEFWLSRLELAQFLSE